MEQIAIELILRFGHGRGVSFCKLDVKNWEGHGVFVRYMRRIRNYFFAGGGGLRKLPTVLTKPVTLRWLQWAHL